MADFNKPFISPSHVAPPLLDRSDMAWMKTAEWVQIACAIISISGVILLGCYAGWITHQPYWATDVAKLENTQAKLREYELTRKNYISLVNHLNQRIRFDLLAQPLLLSDGDTTRLETVEYQTNTLGSRLTGRLSATAISTNADVEAAKSWLRRLRARLQQAFPTREVQMTLMESAIDQRTGNLRFLFTVQIE